MHRSGRATNGEVELAWEQWNDSGEPLLLVNGLGSPRVAFENGFLEQLAAAGFAVARFDNRDIGESSRCPGAHPTAKTYEVADMAADVVAVLDDLGWDRAHVFGQSMGGMIVQQLAIDHPERIRTMTSLMSSTGARGVARPTEAAMEALMRVGPAGRDDWLEYRVETERIWASPAQWDPDWVRAKAGQLYDHGIDADGSARQYKALADSVRDDGLADLEIPTLVMHGSADTLIPPDAGRHTAAVIPGARYVEIDGMGHDLHPAFWPRLVSELRSFAINDLS